MPIEIANIALPRIHRIVTQERADFISHRIPGLAGDIVQDMGRPSVRLRIDGIFYGRKAKDDLENLRKVYKDRKPVDFIADIVGQAYFSQVIIEQLEVRQLAEEQEQFSYQLIVVEYVPPPQPAKTNQPKKGKKADTKKPSKTGKHPTDSDARKGLGDKTGANAASQTNLNDKHRLSNGGYLKDAGSFDEDDAYNLEGTNLFDDPMDAKLSGRAKQFMEMVQVPDLLDASGLDDPTKPVNSVKSKVDDSLDKAVAPGKQLKTALEGENGMLETMEGFGDKNAPIQNSVIQQLNIFKFDQANPVQQTQSAVSGALKNAEQSATAVPLPTENCKTLVQDRLEEVQTTVAGQTESVVEQSAKGVETLFQQLNQNILGDWTGALDETRVKELTDAATTESDAKVPSSTEVSAVYASGDWKLLVEAARQRTESVNFPAATFRTLLKVWQTQLQTTNRSNLSPEQAMVLNDMQTRLNTVSGWLDKDAKKLSPMFAKSLRDLTQFIDNQFYKAVITPIQTDLQQALDAVDWDDLPKQLDALHTDLESFVASAQQDQWDAVLLGTLESRLRKLRNLPNLTDWTAFSTLPQVLETRKTELLDYATVPSELSPLAADFAPFHTLFESKGIQKLVHGLERAMQHTAQFMKSLDITKITDWLHLALSKVEDGMQLIQTGWARIGDTIQDVTSMMEKMIELVSLDPLKVAIKGFIDEFEKLVFEQLTQLLRPATAFITELFEKIHQILNTFSPEAIQEKINDLINLLSATLKPPAVETAIASSKMALALVNRELSQFSIAPVTTFVVERIGVLQSGFEISGRMPMPASARKRMIASLNKLPTAQRVSAKINGLNSHFQSTIDTKVKKNLELVVAALQKVEAMLDQYSPEKLFTSDLFKPYDEIVTVIKSMNASRLMQPVLAFLNDWLNQLEQKLVKVPIFEPLQPYLDKLKQNIGRLDLTEAFKPIQAQLTEQITRITSKIPLQQAEVVLEFVHLIAGEVEKGVQVGEAMRGKLDTINTIFAGFNDPDARIQEATEHVLAQLEEKRDFNPITLALTDLNAALTKITDTGLSEALLPNWTLLLENIEKLAPQSQYDRLETARQVFTPEFLEKCPDSNQIVTLQSMLQGLEALQQGFQPLAQSQQTLTEAKTNFETFLSSWQAAFDADDSPLLRFKDADAPTLLQNQVESSFKIILAPVFVSVNRFQEHTAAQIGTVTGVIAHFENQGKALLEVEQHFAATFASLKNFIAEINRLDITFLAANWKKILDAVIRQLDGFRLKELDDFLKSCVMEMLKMWSPDEVLARLFPVSDPDDGKGAGLEKFDAWQATLIADVEQFDPRKILMEPLQTAFEQIKSDIVIFDVRDTLVLFLETLEKFQKELSEELEKTLHAYEGLIESIPKDLKGSVGKSTSND